jgi:hypothetical protein
MIYVLDELSKPAVDVIKTASKRGYVIDGDWLEHLDNIRLDQAFTKKELRDYLREVVYHYNDAQPDFKLKLKEAKILGGRFLELDSTNLSHAGVYYRIVIRLPNRSTKFLEEQTEIYNRRDIHQFDLI